MKFRFILAATHDDLEILLASGDAFDIPVLDYAARSTIE